MLILYIPCKTAIPNWKEKNECEEFLRNKNKFLVPNKNNKNKEINKKLKVSVVKFQSFSAA